MQNDVGTDPLFVTELGVSPALCHHVPSPGTFLCALPTSFPLFPPNHLHSPPWAQTLWLPKDPGRPSLHSTPVGSWSHASGVAPDAEQTPGTLS